MVLKLYWLKNPLIYCNVASLVDLQIYFRMQDLLYVGEGDMTFLEKEQSCFLLPKSCCVDLNKIKSENRDNLITEKFQNFPACFHLSLSLNIVSIFLSYESNFSALKVYIRGPWNLLHHNSFLTLILRYYATFKVRKFESLFYKVNACLKKTSTWIRLQAEQIFSVN